MLVLMDGVAWLMASLLYEAELRLQECLRIRIMGIDIGYRQIISRDGKGQESHFNRQIERVRIIHRQDLKQGLGNVYLPYALERKYPTASWEFKIWGHNI